MQQTLLNLEPVRKLYTVSELNARIRSLLDQEFGEAWVAGEISGARLAPSGHYYFTLKDEEAQVRCACFRMAARYLKFKPADGVAVIARGRLDVFEARGEYQLIVEYLEPQGYGALQLAFEQLKKKLTDEGLFDASRKRPLPKYPERIGIVTSPAGAVIQDMVNILSRRFPGLHIQLYPASVQGEESVQQICRGIRWFSKSGWAEVVIVARGGGSLEDLWSFNEESVAREIANSAVPVVSAVGHETDFTIADFVADLRAPTPSAAAELIVCTREQVLDAIAGYRRNFEQQLRYRLSIAARRLHERGIERAASLLHRSVGRAMQRVDELERCGADATRRNMTMARQRWQELDMRLRRMDLRLRLSDARQRHRAAVQRLENLTGERIRMERNRLWAAESGLRPIDLTRRLDVCRSSVTALHSQLTHLNPLNILERGYAIVQDEQGRVIKSSAEAFVGSPLRVRVARGSFNVRVEDPRI